MIPEVTIWLTFNSRDNKGSDPPAEDEEENAIENFAEERIREKLVVENNDGEFGQRNDRIVEELACPNDLMYSHELDGWSIATRCSVYLL